MSGGGGGIIIIRTAAESNKATPAERELLHAIADRSVAGCNLADAYRAARIIRKILRRP